MKRLIIKCGSGDGVKLITINNESIYLQSPSPMNVGQNLNCEIPLPGDLGVLPLTGKVTKVVPMNEEAQKKYICLVKIGPLDDVNRKILSAYVEYCEREKVIDEAFEKWEVYDRYLTLLAQKNPSNYLH